MRNFLRAGVLKNSCSIEIEVPTGQPTCFTLFTFPPARVSLVPVSAFSVRVVNSICETADMLGSASPRKPSVLIVGISSALLILLVECLSRERRASSLSIPQPLSATLIKSLPPLLTSTATLVAPASIEFSTSSFTTEAGLSMTSPADILFITSSGRICILAATFFLDFLLQIIQLI